MVSEKGGVEMAGRTILVVEDNDDLRMSFVDMFDLMGFSKILVAKNGQEGVELYKQHVHEIHAVLTDFNMSPGDGIYLLHEVRRLSQERGRKVRVVVITGTCVEEVLRRLEAEGFDAILKKPAEIADIRKEVCNLPS